MFTDFINYFELHDINNIFINDTFLRSYKLDLKIIVNLKGL